MLLSFQREANNSVLRSTWICRRFEYRVANANQTFKMLETDKIAGEGGWTHPRP